MNWRGRRVLITGHTGFKGRWLWAWLTSLGAAVAGYSLPEDVRYFDPLMARVQRVRPDIIIHLAAQAVVGDAFAMPRYTFGVNTMGTVNVLDAAMVFGCPVVVVTTDKVYAESAETRKETDTVWGHEAYGASKAAAELAASSYRHSHGVRLVTARAGNCIGGGEGKIHRLVPNCMEALKNGQPIVVNDPTATRPWQHVLEPLHGYIMLAERLLEGADVEGPWNFGPDEEWSVERLVERIIELWGSGSWTIAPAGFAEAKYLALDSAKAKGIGWEPRWTTDEAVSRTVAFYKSPFGGMARKRMIQDYEEGL